MSTKNVKRFFFFSFFLFLQSDTVFFIHKVKPTLICNAVFSLLPMPLLRFELPLLNKFRVMECGKYIYQNDNYIEIIMFSAPFYKQQLISISCKKDILQIFVLTAEANKITN